MMPLFKAVLLLCLLVLAYPVFFRARLLFVQRLLGAGIGALLAVFVIFPDVSTRIGHFFGIGRGVDFLFYLAHLFVLYIVIRLYVRQQHLRMEVTELTRTIALLRAEPPSSTETPPNK